MVQAEAVTVRRQIVVDAPIERAFAVFTDRFGDFKPPEHNLLGTPIIQTAFEPRVGGAIVDRAEDGSECRWARILAYEPPHRVVFSWGHMDGPAVGNGSPAVGTKCLTTRRIGGANRVVTAELAHIGPPRTWGVRGIDGPIRAAVDLVVEPISVDFAGHGIGKALVPLVRREVRKEMPDNLAALKQRLEAS